MPVAFPFDSKSPPGTSTSVFRRRSQILRFREPCGGARSRRLVTLGLVAVLVACSDPVTPVGRGAHPASILPRASAVNYTPAYTKMLPVADPHDTQLPLTLLGHFDPQYLTWVEVTAEGLITGTYQSPHPRAGETVEYDAAGVDWPYSACVAAVSFKSDYGWGGFGCGTHVTTTRFHVKGDVFVTRNK